MPQIANISDLLAQLRKPKKHQLDRLCGKLEDLDWRQRKLLLENLRDPVHLGVGEALIRRAESLRHEDPKRMKAFAVIGLQVLTYSRAREAPAFLLQDARATGWVTLANANRILGRLQSADICLRRASSFLMEGTGDPLVFAKFQRIKGALFLERAEHEKAAEEYLGAIRLYKEVGDDFRAGRTLLSLAKVFGDSGNLEAAFRCLHNFMNSSASQSPALLFHWAKNFAAYLGDAGLLQEALHVLKLARPLFRGAGAVLALRMRWIEAQLLADLGVVNEAALAFDEIRESLREKELATDFVLASLDLAKLEAGRGGWQLVLRLSAEIRAFCQIEKLPRHIEAACALLEGAAVSKRLDGARLTAIRQTLASRGWNQPLARKD